MITVLFAMGIVIIVIGILSGLLGLIYSFSLGLFAFMGSIPSAMVFFGLAKLLDKHDDILIRIDELERKLRQPAVNITCARCGKEHVSDCSSCPHCAFRPGL